MTIEFKIPTEEQARAMVTCPACGGDKAHNGLVCWDCFKYRHNDGFRPLKYAGLSFGDWMEQVVMPWKAARN